MNFSAKNHLFPAITFRPTSKRSTPKKLEALADVAASRTEIPFLDIELINLDGLMDKSTARSPV